jgi:hypothetical protein
MIHKNTVLDANVHVTPPFKITLSPLDNLADPDHPDIPGAYFHGNDVDVPLLESEPLAKST